MEQLAFTVEEARAFLSVGSVGVAEMILRTLIQKNPEDVPALRMMAHIARAMGERAWAAEFSKRAGENIADIPPTSSAPGEKYLLIKAWGNGFCSDIDHTLGHLLLAEMTGRVPVIHWGRNSLFGLDPEKDAFAHFFEPVSGLVIDDLIDKGHDFFPPKWTDANLRSENVNKIDGMWSRLPPLVYMNRPERVAVGDVYAGVINLAPWIRPGHPMHGKSTAEVYRYLIEKYLRVRPEIQKEIDDFARANFEGRGPITAAHIRGSDKHREDPQLEQKNAVYPKEIARMSAAEWFPRVFLLTDSVSVREDFARRYGQGLITTDCIRSDTNVGVHLQKHEDRKRIGVEVLRDAWLAARCDRFIGLGSSNVTCLVYHLKDWPTESRTIIGPVMTHMLNPYLYMTLSQLERYLPPDMMDKLRERARQEREASGIRAPA